jgi:uncharacterized protein
MTTQTSPLVVSAPPAANKSTKTGHRWRRLVAVLLALSAVLTFGYAAIAIYIAKQLVYKPQVPPHATPASLGLQYKEVTFPSRKDHIQLQGWFIPGLLPNGSLTTQSTIIFVHGTRANRADQSAGLLNLSCELARHGFAVLSFDMRGNGESPPAPLSLGYFEQRDILGAVDFLRSGSLPYPQLGRPNVIVGWGLSMGGSALLLAAAQEPSISAIVSDSAATDYISILQREVPKQSHLPPLITPGALLAARAIYGIDYYAVRPVDVLARLAPRPLFFIHGEADSYVPSSNIIDLAAAARSAPNANVQTWLVPGADHSQSYNTQPQEYISRVVAFYTAALGPDSSVSQ